MSDRDSGTSQPEDRLPAVREDVTMDLTNLLRIELSGIPIKVWRFSLETPHVMATLPMLRGVWGAALRELSSEAYREAFEGGDDRARATPGYVLRPARPEGTEQTAVEWLLFGRALRHEGVLLRAWDVASGMGLGKERERFFIRNARLVGANERPSGSGSDPWLLSEAQWSLPGDPTTTPVSIGFEAPLRLVRRQRLIEQPTFQDVVRAGLRRIAALTDKPLGADLAAHCLHAAAVLPSLPWEGRRLDFQRYSGRQECEVDLHGVCGRLVLPEGPGMLWPLLAGLRWTHLGKGTVFGLGQPVLEVTDAAGPY